MAENTKILSAEDAEKLLRPIDEHIGEIQKKIDALRVDGADKVAELTDELRMAKESKTLTAEQKEKIRKKDEALLSEAKKTEAANKAQVEKLIAEGEAYLKAHYNTEYLDKIKASGAGEREAAAATYSRKVEALKAEHEKSLAALKGKLASASGEEKTTLQKEIKDETYVFKNRMFDAKMVYRKDLQAVKDREHEAFTHEYHLIDLLRKRSLPSHSRGHRAGNFPATPSPGSSSSLETGCILSLSRSSSRWASSHRQSSIRSCYGNQHPEHPAAGIAAYVPCAWRCRTDPPDRNRPFNRPYDGYGHGDLHDYHAQGTEYRDGVWKSL